LYAGGDLQASEAREVAEHLSGCPACRDDLAKLTAGVAALNAAGVDESMLPADDPTYWHELEGKLRARAIDVEHLRTTHAWWRRAPRLLAQAAVVLIAAGAVLWFILTQQTPPEHVEQPEVVTYTRDAPRPRYPLIVVLPARGMHRQVEVTTAAADDNETDYSDFGLIRRAGEIRRLRNSVVPATYEDDGPF